MGPNQKLKPSQAGGVNIFNVEQHIMRKLQKMNFALNAMVLFSIFFISKSHQINFLEFLEGKEVIGDF